MRRRDFLATGFGFAAFLKTSSLLADEETDANRAAVVIGVDKCGNLPKLNAAASGARQVGKWLEGEHFTVEYLCDDTGPVTGTGVFHTVSALVNPGNLDQLVIYFSGHGFLSGYAEYWMLSEGPENPNEAISLVESRVLARQTRIPSVVFISDACRSTPDSLGASRVRGQLIFPNKAAPAGGLPVHTAVDTFYAAFPGEAASELPLAESIKNYEAIFTSCFLQAFQTPDDDMVISLNDGLKVVPNRKLIGFLEREVPKKAQAKSLQIQQVPDAEIQSEGTTFIGRVIPHPLATVGEARIPSIFDAATLALQGTGAGAPDRLNGLKIEGAAAETHFAIATASIRVATAGDAAVARILTGFTVVGQKVADVIGVRAHGKISFDGDGVRPTIIEVLGFAKAASVGLEFADGSGAVLAALRGFIGTVVLDQNGIRSVSYFPSPLSPRFADYDRQRGRIEELHATVAAAANFGAFRIEGDRSTRNERAEQMADTIRVLKAVDPTLGIYAAYAYDAADLGEKVQSVRDFMRDDLGFDLFDVQMLSGEAGYSVVPFCPMLTQGWELLRVKGVVVPPVLSLARNHLKPCLWTTFKDTGWPLIRDNLKGPVADRKDHLEPDLRGWPSGRAS